MESQLLFAVNIKQKWVSVHNKIRKTISERTSQRLKAKLLGETNKKKMNLIDAEEKIDYRQSLTVNDMMP